MKPLRYDFPHRMRDLSGCKREVRRIRRSLLVAEKRGDTQARDYLQRRYGRAYQAYRNVRRSLGLPDAQIEDDDL